MNFLEKHSKIERLHSLIRRKATGTPIQLASKLKVSRATAYRYMEIFKNKGAHIKYCRTRESFYYQEEFELNF